MSKVCLDTGAYAHFRQGSEAAVQAIRHARIVGIPAVVLGELRAGFRLGTKRVENERALRMFLRQAAVSLLVIDDEAASHYAEIVVELRRAGTPLPTSDIWIAAIAARDGATVLTYDQHFTLISRVGTELLSRT